MYQSYITSTRQALLHLLVHCCQKDGECNEKEVHTIGAIMNNLYGTAPDVCAAMKAYQSYAKKIKDEMQYLRFLLHHIKNLQRFALLWYCTRVAASDEHLAFSEELLISRLSKLLEISSEECRTMYLLAMQVQAVEQCVTDQQRPA